MLSSYIIAASFLTIKRFGFLAFLIVCIPYIVVGAPANEESLKQQIASGMLRGDDLWNPLNQEVEGSLNFPSQFYSRSGLMDSLGRGNILRSLDGMGNDWGDTKGSGWRVDYVGGNPKRGGGLDSLGRGNILRRINYNDEIYNAISSLCSSHSPRQGRTIDSLGGNILKRTVRLSI